MKTPMWFRVVSLVVLIAVFLAVVFWGGSRILEIWAQSRV